MKKQTKRKAEVMTEEDTLAVVPLHCIFCGDPHLKILGLNQRGHLVILCENCMKIQILFGKEIRIKKNKSADYFG